MTEPDPHSSKAITMNAAEKEEKEEEKEKSPVPATAPTDAARFPSEKWIKSASRSDLIELISKLANELQARNTPDETHQVAPSDTGPFSTDNLSREVHEFVRLTSRPTEKGEASEAAIQRIVLISSNPNHAPLGLELHGDITLGRVVGDSRPHLDLTKYDAEKHGVSRLHAVIHPTEDEVILADLGSLNGTRVNGERLKFNEPRTLKNLDTISLGGLHFKLRIIPKKDEQDTKPDSKD